MYVTPEIKKPKLFIERCEKNLFGGFYTHGRLITTPWQEFKIFLKWVPATLVEKKNKFGLLGIAAAIILLTMQAEGFTIENFGFGVFTAIFLGNMMFASIGGYDVYAASYARLDESYGEKQVKLGKTSWHPPHFRFVIISTIVGFLAFTVLFLPAILMMTGIWLYRS